MLRKMQEAATKTDYDDDRLSICFYWNQRTEMTSLLFDPANKFKEEVEEYESLYFSAFKK